MLKHPHREREIPPPTVSLPATLLARQKRGEAVLSFHPYSFGVSYLKPGMLKQVQHDEVVAVSP